VAGNKKEFQEEVSRMKLTLIVLSLICVALVAGCVGQSQIPQDIVSNLLRGAYPSVGVRSQVLEIPAGTVIENVELARIVGMNYTELGLFADEETKLIVERDNSERQNMTAPKTVTVIVEVDCRKRGQAGYLDCMIRFHPLGWSEEQELIDTISLSMARERRNSTFCNEIVDAEWKALCFDVARWNNEPSQCESLGNMTYFCYKEIAKRRNDASYCNNILYDEDYYNWCMGVANRDSFYCDEIVSRRRGDSCFSEVAVLTGEFYTCDKVIDDTDRLDCIQNAVKNSDIEECSSLFFKTETDIKSCNIGIALRRLERELIERIESR